MHFTRCWQIIANFVTPGWRFISAQRSFLPSLWPTHIMKSAFRRRQKLSSHSALPVISRNNLPRLLQQLQWWIQGWYRTECFLLWCNAFTVGKFLMCISCHHSEAFFTVGMISYSITFIQLPVAIRLKLPVWEIYEWLIRSSLAACRCSALASGAQTALKRCRHSC